MASYQPELHTAESVLAYYDNFDAASYSVYVGHKVDPKSGRYSYTGNDKNEGREQLMNALNAILQNPENTNTYCIAIFANKGKKIEEINSISFQLNKRQSMQPYQQVGAFNPNLMNEINALRSEIAALKMQQELDDQDEEEEEPEEENFLAGIMKSPQVQTMILSQLSSLFAPQQKVTHVAGVDETATDQDEKIDEAIEILKKHDPSLGDDLLRLCEIAENDPMQWKMLLKMLR